MGANKIGWAPLYVMRCMSKEEFSRYKNGETLRNLNTHGGWKTDAIGFCFFPVSRTCESVEQRLRYLAGIVSLDIVAVFATTPGTWLTRATGWYRNPDFDIQAFNRLEVVNSAMTKKTEFCTTVYDKSMLKLIGWGRPYYITGHGWYVQWQQGKNQIANLGG